ncbi:MAG: hypothetical protein AAGK79_07970 [Pseudomonadota bacterium]
MSDPVTNMEIEDVLSSIRRLVSTETQPDGRTKNVGADPDPNAEPNSGSHTLNNTDAETSVETSETSETPEEAPRSEPKLVLTPAQRVNEDAQPEHTAEGSAEGASHSDADGEATHPQGADDADMDGEHSVDVTADDEAGEGEAETARDTDTDTGTDTDTDEAASDFSAEHPAGHSPDLPEPSEDKVLDMVAEDLTALVAADAVAELATQLPTHKHGSNEEPDQAIDSGSEGDTGPDPDGDALVDQGPSFDDLSDPDVPEFLRRPITQMDPPEDAEIVAQDDPDQPDSPPVTLTSKLETLEEAVADRAEDWEPDGGDQDSLSSDDIEPLPWTEIEAEVAEMPADEVEADPYSEAQAQAAQTGAATPPWFGEDALIDEDALRDMVGEIVRQELQGALGERITRNVRKLVRREIHRALMSQGLD